MKYTERKIILLSVSNAIMLLIGISGAYCQNKFNFLQVTGYNSSFSLTDATALTTQLTNTNAFQLVAGSKASNSFSLYAKVSSSTNSSGTPLPASMLAVKLNSMAPTLTASYNTITLNTNDQLLQQITTPNQFWNNNNAITFNYDLQAGPVGYDYAPGNYSLTILFTMTQP